MRGAGDRGGSFGLGLAIVRAVAESHGGNVSVEQTHPGTERPGARFVVMLPEKPGTACATDAPSPSVSAGDRIVHYSS